MNGQRTATTLGLVAVLAALAAVAIAGIIDSVQTIDDARQDRHLYASLSERERVDYPLATLDPAGAFRQFKETLRPGERFAIVVSAGVPDGRASFYRLFGLYYLYPAIAAGDALRADAILVFGPVPQRLLGRFEGSARSVGYAWIGRRR
jgi:hypothetical protein